MDGLLREPSLRACPAAQRSENFKYEFLPQHPRGSVTRCSDARADTVEVRLALRCLLPHCRERWPLELYWDAASQDNEIGREQGVTAAFNGMVRQLRLAGRYV